MSISVKGIQYSYQIDYFNQVPTHVKSQVHDLPVLSVPEPTPIDKNIGRDTVILNNDNRFSYAGTRAAPSLNQPAEEAILATEPMVVAAAAPAAITPEQTESSVIEPALIQNRIGSEASIARPAFQPVAETLGNPLAVADDAGQKNTPPLHETPPRQDATPDIAVKAIPRQDYIRAMRAYKPDAFSFLQPGGYEKADFSRTEFYNEPADQPSPALPAASPVKEELIAGITENRAQRIENQDPAERAPKEFRGVSDPDFQPQTDQAEKMQLKGENFLARQAFRIYEMIAQSSMLATGNQIDLYF